jgi:hypothetical protein
MNDWESLKPTELPIACTLHANDTGERLARWRALSARGAPSVEREADVLVVAYPAGQSVAEELEVLAAAERQCCSFAEWEVEQDTDRVILRISSHPDGLAAIAALFDDRLTVGQRGHG